MADNKTVWIGSDDLRFLGMIAAIAARNARRLGDRGWDVHSLEQFISGIQVGREIPLDDLPALRLGVTANGEVLKRIRRMDQRAGFSEMGFSDEEVEEIVAELEGDPPIC